MEGSYNSLYHTQAMEITLCTAIVSYLDNWRKETHSVVTIYSESYNVHGDMYNRLLPYMLVAEWNV